MNITWLCATARPFRSLMNRRETITAICSPFLRPECTMQTLGPASRNPTLGFYWTKGQSTWWKLYSLPSWGSYSPGWCNLIHSISENKQEHKHANAHQFTQPFCPSTCLVRWNNEATVQLLKSQGQVWAYSALRGACLLTWHTNWLEHQDKETRGAVGEKPETTFEGWDT